MQRRVWMVGAAAALMAGCVCEIETESLPDGVVGTRYNVQLRASTGCGPGGDWSSTGRLPSGLEVTRSGRIEGTPRFAGTYTFRVYIDTGDESGDLLSINSKSLTLVIRLKDE